MCAGDAQAAVAYARTGLAQDGTPTLCERLVPLAARALADEIQGRRDRAADASTAVPGRAARLGRGVRAMACGGGVHPGTRHPGPGAAALRRAYELAVTLEAAPLLAQVGALAESARVALVADPVEEPPAPSLHGLTAREHQIVALVVAGRTYAEIARTLVISEKTVSSHISHILAETGAANRVELAQLARRRSTG